MNVRDIVRKAWQITQVHLKKLIWYGAIPAFFHTLVSGVYIAYQYNAFRHSSLFGEAGTGTGLTKDLGFLWQIISSHPKLTVLFIITGILVLIGNILLPPVFRGTLIHALMRIRNYETITGSMEIGIRRFFPMFEFALITGSFSIITVFTESSFILRWWGENIFFFALPILLFIATVGLIVSFLFTYSEYFIVLENKRIIQSIAESAILVLSNLRKTILIFLLILLISVRVILNVIIVLCIPTGLVFLAGWLATTFLQVIGIAIALLLAVVILLVTSYLMGLFNVFSTAVWVFSYAELTNKNNPQTKDVDLKDQ